MCYVLTKPSQLEYFHVLRVSLCFMKGFNFITRQFSASQFEGLVSTTQKSLLSFQGSAFTEETVEKILDQCRDIETLKKLHSKILIDDHHRCSASLGIKLMRAYSACGQPGMTRNVFDGFSDKNIVFFNVLIRSYVNNKFYSDALLAFKSIYSDGFVPDNYTYPCIIKACFSYNDMNMGLQVHAAVTKIGLVSNLFVGNGLIAMYGKRNCLLEARQVLDETPRKDVVSWNSMVAGYAQNARFDDALEICREMEAFGQTPDAGTMASLLPAVRDTSSSNVCYVKEMFMKLETKSLVSWNVMIAVYMKNSMPGDAIDLYLEMEKLNVEPDAITLASVLPACGDFSAVLLGKRIHARAERKKLCPNLLLENALIEMYARCGCLNDAREVFNKMNFRDVASWTSLISAYGMTGKGRDAVLLFMEMLDSGLTPDSIAFVAVLSACSHSGLLNDGKNFFKMMTDNYRIPPRIEHFSCMVDLLGRSGKVKEAYNLIQGMPIEPNERVWGALLSSCRVHSDMDIGVVAADQLFQLLPKQSGYYVLLSNIYAKAGRWQDVTKIRSLMKNRKVKKLPGMSNVELNDRVYTFLVGDRSHPQSEKIYEELDILVGKMREMGYVPETDSALHDVEDEDKECHLAIHSEKLAIVFAILNTNPGTPIRITKNLRVCGDCHIAAKLISKIVQREIIVRDRNRFHHFSNGTCSCGDYW